MLSVSIEKKLFETIVKFKNIIIESVKYRHTVSNLLCKIFGTTVYLKTRTQLKLIYRYNTSM